ncbi:hypothetical protein LTR74_016745 [Friedmanniomyces endolithicus]|nr:hypothetical protein LTR74_016745 [Friedmanniomyces endolithicus]
MALTLLVNIWGFRLVPAIQLLAFFFALLIPLVLLSRRSSNEFVWETFPSQGGWENSGVSYSIGLLTVVYCFIGFDGAIHMSEETRNAATTIPNVLLLTVGINGALAFAFLIAVLYSIGNVNAALNTPTGYPIIEIFYQAPIV